VAEAFELGDQPAGVRFVVAPGQPVGAKLGVHYIGVNWPHHIFVKQDFTVVGAD
jgi:hypothetical protein